MCSVPQVPMDQSFGLSGAAWNHWLARRTIPAGQQLTAAGSQLRTFHCLIYAVNWGLCVFTWDHSWWNLESLDNLDIFQRFSESTVLMIRKMPRLAEIGDLWKSAPSYRPRASEFVFGAAQVWAWSSDPRAPKTDSPSTWNCCCAKGRGSRPRLGQWGQQHSFWYLAVQCCACVTLQAQKDLTCSDQLFQFFHPFPLFHLLPLAQLLQHATATNFLHIPRGALHTNCSYVQRCHPDWADNQSFDLRTSQNFHRTSQNTCHKFA